MRAYPRDDAVAVYRRLYWDLPARRPPSVSSCAALNALNRSGRDYPDLAVDHRIGAQTLAALTGFLRVRGAPGEAVLLKALDALQGERYVALAEGPPANEAFLYGWLANRIG